MASKDKCLEEIKNAPEMIVSMLTYGPEEDWELGMEKMKRRRFLEEDMEQIYKKIEAETHQTHKTTTSQELQEWAKSLASTVKSVRDEAEKGNTSLYQATELMKITEPSFLFVCKVMKNSFNLSKEGEKLLKDAEAQFRHAMKCRLDDDDDDSDPEELLQKCFETLKRSIEAAKADSAAFEKWQVGKSFKQIEEDGDPKAEMEDIVTGEKNELEVMLGYCKSDLTKIGDHVKGLDLKTEEFKDRLKVEIEGHQVAIKSNKQEQEELRQRLRKLEEEETRMKNEIARKEHDCKTADKELAGAKGKIRELEDKIKSLLGKTETSHTIITKMEGVAREILGKAEKTGKEMDETARKHKTDSLVQLRETLLTEMLLRQQHIDNMEENVKEAEKVLKDTEEELLKAKKKGFKPKITELKGRKEDYQEEKSKTEKDLGENKVRMKELEKALDDIDNTWKTFDPSVQLTQFEMHYEDFKQRYDDISKESAAEMRVICKAISA